MIHPYQSWDTQIEHANHLLETCQRDRRLDALHGRPYGQRDDGEERSHKKLSGSVVCEYLPNQYGSSGAYANSVVPESYIVLLPLVANVDFLGGRDEFIEVADDRGALSHGNADDGCDKARVEEDGFPASDRIRTDQRVL